MSDVLGTLTDGRVTLRPWSDSDAALLDAGRDAAVDAYVGPFAGSAPDRHAYVITLADGTAVGACALTERGESTGELTWLLFADHRRSGYATRAVRILVDWAVSDVEQGGLGLGRVEARVEQANEKALRVATRAGLRREGMVRIAPGTALRPDVREKALFARLSTDPPLSDPSAFRSLLNSILPRKRAIAQMLVRDRSGRVLMCQLTYKTDWDLPGGVVEVDESPRLAVTREVAEELALDIEAGDLLLTDWLPPWSGWEDALCLVFDGGTIDAAALAQVVRQEREIKSVEFCTLEQVRERAADFTFRRIEAAVSGRRGFTESGR